MLLHPRIRTLRGFAVRTECRENVRLRQEDGFSPTALCQSEDPSLPKNRLMEVRSKRSQLK
jgi:hypothetical protein